MTEQDKKLLKAYDLLKRDNVDKLYEISCINDYFYDTDDELKIKLVDKLRSAWLGASNNVPLIEVAYYMWHITEDEDYDQTITIDELLEKSDRVLGNDAFDYYYMSLC